MLSRLRKSLSLFIINIGLRIFAEESPSVRTANQCSIWLAESIPSGTAITPQFRALSTFDAWMDLLKHAEKTVDIAAFYWYLLDKDGFPTSTQGAEVFKAIEAAAKRGVKVRIVGGDVSIHENKAEEYLNLQKNGLAEVRMVNFTRTIPREGVLHTKLLVADRKHFYVGSANMDWRSLTEVKELGVLVKDCPPLAEDIQKVFEIYWLFEILYANKDQGQRKEWPIELSTQFNASNPIEISFIKPIMPPLLAFISHSPASLNSEGREHDLDAILNTMMRAKKTIRISVMDYSPASLFSKNNSFWPSIDNAIRSAAFRGVRVQMLVSDWKHTKSSMVHHLRSLINFSQALPLHYRRSGGKRGSITIKWYKVPPNPHKEAPYTRVNHAKYMVTDCAAYIGTSNWSADYFVSSAGIGLHLERIPPTTKPSLEQKDENGGNSKSRDLIDDLHEIFERDWNSSYTREVN